MEKVSRWGPSVNLRVVAYVCIAALLVVLGVHAASTMRRPFGISHDGVNGSVWGWGSRALRTEGVVWSRAGTRRREPEGVSTYANHPPLLIVEAAAAEEVLGEHPWSTRLPAIVATAVALLGTVALLRTLGLGWAAAAGGAALGFGVPMIGVYGTMLDTPVVGLAPAVVLLLLDARGRRGLRSPPVAIVATAAICVLSSWQGVVIAGFLAAAATVRTVRKRPHPHDGALIAGSVVGVVLLAGWMWWAFGSWAHLSDQMRLRSGLGSRPRTIGNVLHALRDDAGDLFPVWVAGLALPAFVVGVRDRRTRWAIGVSLVTLAVWVLGLRDGAVIHDYWPYWAVLPLSIGFGAGLDLLLTSVPALRSSRTAAGVAIVAAVLGVVGLTMSVPAGQAQAAGSRAGRLLRATHWPPAQRVAWTVGGGHVSLDWVTYYTHRRAGDLADVNAVEALARDRPNDLVLIVPGGPVPGHPCTPRIRRGSPYALVPAADVVRGLDGDVVRPC